MKPCLLAWRGLGRVAVMLLCGGIAVLPAFAVSSADVSTVPRARFSVVEGAVWRYSPEAARWVGAEPDRPLTMGDRLSTDASGRAEWRVGSSVVRLDSGTEIALLHLDDARLQLQLQRGSVLVRLRDNDRASDFELVTAEGSFRVGRAGQYRFDRQGDHSQATVWGGQAQFTGRNQALTIDSGQRAEFFVGAGGRLQYAIVDPVADAFSAWNDERDRADRAQVQPFVLPEMNGAEALDPRYRWEYGPGYGPLWFPPDGGPGHGYPPRPHDHERWHRDDPRDSRFDRERERERERDRDDRDQHDVRPSRPQERPQAPPPHVDSGRGKPHEISTLPAPPAAAVRVPIPARMEPTPVPPAPRVAPVPPSLPPRVMPLPPVAPSSAMPPPAPAREVEHRRPEPARDMEPRRPEPPHDEADQRRQRPAPVLPNAPDDTQRERRRAN